MTTDGSAHAEFWLAIMEPEQKKRITAANAWLERWVKTCVMTQAIAEDIARLGDPGFVASMQETAKRALGQEIIQKACRVKERPRQPGSWERRTDFEVTVLLAKRPLLFPMLPPEEP